MISNEFQRIVQARRQSEQLSRPERAVERSHHTVPLERGLVTHEADDPIDIATPRCKVVVITHLRLDEDETQPIELGAECIGESPPASPLSPHGASRAPAPSSARSP